jgi:formate hydrogenlyase transcriptional activator
MTDLTAAAVEFVSEEPAATPSEPSYDRLVGELLEQLNMGRSFEQLFDSVYDQLQGTVPYNRIAVALLEGRPPRLRLTSCRSDGNVSLKIGYLSRLAGSTLGPLVQSGRARIINDLEAYLDHKPHSKSTRLILSEGMRSNLTLPLIADGKPLGVIFFSSREKHVYRREHVLLLRRLAGHIAISLEKARWIESLKQKNEQLAEANQTKDKFLVLLKDEVQRQTEQLRFSEQRYRLLVRLGQIVNSSLNVRDVFQCAAIEIHKLLRCDLVSFRSSDPAEPDQAALAIEFEPTGSWTWTALSADDWGPGSEALISTQDSPSLGRAEAEERDFGEGLVGLVDASLSSRSAPRRKLAGSFPTVPREGEVGSPIRVDTHASQKPRYHRDVRLSLISRGRQLGILRIASAAEQGDRRLQHVESPEDLSDESLEEWDSELLSEMAAQLSVAIDNASAYGSIDRLKRQLEQQNVYLREEIRTDHNFGDIIGASRPMQQVRQAIHQVARTDSTVLILGETGTGKELIARAIHDESQRRDRLMVKVNCAALAPHLITSELFGHESGAFTGATTQRIGRFELADGGSIFLDEISEMPAEAQVMLLRVLQERVFERVGGSTPIAVDTRVIAATNRDLRAHAEEGHFRDDLYYRLHVFPIRVPPLRERSEDIPALLDHFIGRFADRMNKQITRVPRQTMELLLAYHWPGNVRELENVIERATIVSSGDALVIDPTWLSGQASAETVAAGIGVRPLAEVQRKTILDALQARGGKVYGRDGAAALLGLKPTTLYGKMRKLGIKIQRQSLAGEPD